jgi:DNA-binding MarR family transcriptional regulator
MPQVTTLPRRQNPAPNPASNPSSSPASATDSPVDQIQAALQMVAGSITQIRVHERLLRAAGVRLDRAGAALLYKLYVHGDSLRVTALAELLGVDAPTVTRKIQQLERAELVSRHADPDDGRATRIKLTRAGKRTIERVFKARREWFDEMIEDWDEADVAAFAALLTKFAGSMARNLGDARVG